MYSIRWTILCLQIITLIISNAGKSIYYCFPKRLVLCEQTPTCPQSIAKYDLSAGLALPFLSFPDKPVPLLYFSQKNMTYFSYTVLCLLRLFSAVRGEGTPLNLLPSPSPTGCAFSPCPLVSGHPRWSTSSLWPCPGFSGVGDQDLCFPPPPFGSHTQLSRPKQPTLPRLEGSLAPTEGL